MADAQARADGVVRGGLPAVSGQPPRLSVGIPVFNGARYLEETLRSILGQTFADMEIVISDNGSTDATPEICHAVAARDARVSYHRSDRNRGGAWNHNRVLALAQGEYFKWAAADDLLEPHFLEECVRVLDTHPAYVLCTTGAVNFDDQGVQTPHPDPELRLDRPQPQARFREFICKNHWAMQLYGVIRARTLRRVPPLGGYIGADRNLLAELVLLGPFGQVPEPLLYYRQHSQTSTSLFPDFRTRMEWWNPQRAHAVMIFPVWRRLWEYLASIHRVPLRPRERLGCYGALAQWLVGSRWMSGRWRLLARDLQLAAERLAAPRAGRKARRRTRRRQAA